MEVDGVISYPRPKNLEYRWPKGRRRWRSERHREKVKVLVAQSFPTLWDPVDCSPPGSSVCGILQVRVLEWVAVSFSISSHEHTKITTICRTTIEEKDWNLSEKIFCNQRHKEGATTRWVERVHSQ